MKALLKLSVTSFSFGQEKRNMTISSYRNENHTRSRIVSILALFVLTFLVAAPSFAQEKVRKINQQELQQRSQKGRTIKGIVVENKEALPGVTVQLKGTRRGTETNESGLFQFPLALLNGDVLVFKFLGMKTKEVMVTAKTTFMRVTMEEDSETLEIIVLDAPQTNQLYKSKKSAFKKKKAKAE